MFAALHIGTLLIGFGMGGIQFEFAVKTGRARRAE
jgi:hypothetical protein